MSFDLATVFNPAATPSQALLRHLLYLAGADTGSIISGFKTPDGQGREVAEKSALDFSLFMTILDANARASQQVLQRFHDMLDRADAALALAEAELLATRDELLANAYPLADGTKVFFSEDLTAGYDQHGNRVADELIEDIPLEQRARYSKTTPYDNANQNIDALNDAKAKAAELRTLDDSDLSVQDLEEHTAELDRALSSVPAAQAHYEPPLSTNSEQGSLATRIDGNPIRPDADAAASFNLASNPPARSPAPTNETSEPTPELAGMTLK